MASAPIEAGERARWISLAKRVVPDAVIRWLRPTRPSDASAAEGISPLARSVRQAHLTYTSPAKLRRLEESLDRVRREGVPGDFLECGIALGGTAIVIASALPEGARFAGYDVFGMIPPPTSEKDDEKSRARYSVIASGQARGLGGDRYYGHEEDLFAKVTRTLGEFGVPVDGQRVTLHKGLFEDTLDPPPRVAFAHIDCDWYDPVALCLARIYPKLAPGGIVVLDDYNDYGGCRQAADEFLGRVGDVEVLARTPSLALRRMA